MPLNLTQEQLEQVENLAPLNYTPEKIAIYLGVNFNEFLEEFNDSESQVHYHYTRGILVAQADADMKLVADARAGNYTAYTVWKKESRFTKIDNLKKKVVMEQELSVVNRIQELFASGKSEKLSDQERLYYEMLDFSRSLISKYESKKFTIAALKKSYALSAHEANKIYNESINFFYIDNQVTQEAWGNFYAERLDNAAIIAYEMNDFEVFRRLVHDAAEMRGVFKEKGQELPEDFYDRRPVIYSINPSDLGLPRADRRQLAEYIDSLPDIPDYSRQQLHRDAQTKKISVIDIDPANVEYLTPDENK